MALEPTAIEEKLVAAFDRFLEVYARYGGHRYYGWNKQADPRNYRGPTFWTEGDRVYRLALELEREFPHCVHLEVPVAGWTVADFDKGLESRRFIDLVVSDLHEFVEDESSQERFTKHRHELFLEAKYFHHGSARSWAGTERRRVPSVLADAHRLASHVERGRCRVAAVLVADDDGLFEETVDPSTWPGSVKRLLASPSELRRRQLVSDASVPPHALAHERRHP
jgi:hypothetical protein